MGWLGWVSPWASVNEAPWPASEVRYGASGAPTTESASSFSKTTTRTCAGAGTAPGVDDTADVLAAVVPGGGADAADVHPASASTTATTGAARLTGPSSAPAPPRAPAPPD